MVAEGVLPAPLYEGQWLAWEDEAGPGICQPDFFLVGGRSLLLFECKLTESARAWDQLRGLYAPLLEAHFHRPAICIQVARNLRPDTDVGLIIEGLEEIKDGALWHWLGH